MPVKRPNDTWAAAPESYPKHGSSRTGARNLRAQLLTGLAVVVTVACGAAIFIALNTPRSPTPNLAASPVSAPVTAQATAQPALAADPSISVEVGTSGAPAPVAGSSPATQAASVTFTTASSAEVTVQPSAPAVVPSAEPAPVIAPQLAAAAAAVPATPTPVSPTTQTSTSAQSPATAAAPAPSPAPANSAPSTETSIRSTSVVIGGRTYECYGQVAHLACELKQ